MNEKDTELNILSLRYARHVSMAHTTFSTLIGTVMGVIIGVFAIVFAYSEVYNIKPDSFKLAYLGIHSLIISSIIAITAIITMSISSMERKDIIKKINELKTT